MVQSSRYTNYEIKWSVERSVDTLFLASQCLTATKHHFIDNLNPQLSYSDTSVLIKFCSTDITIYFIQNCQFVFLKSPYFLNWMNIHFKTVRSLVFTEMEYKNIK